MKKNNPNNTNKKNLEKALDLGLLDEQTYDTHLKELDIRNNENKKIIKKKTRELKKSNFKFKKNQINLLSDTPIIILNPLTKPNYV